MVDSGVFCGSGCVFGLVLRVCFWWFVNSLWLVVCVVSDALIGLRMDVLGLMVGLLGFGFGSLLCC